MDATAVQEIDYCGMTPMNNMAKMEDLFNSDDDEEDATGNKTPEQE